MGFDWSEVFTWQHLFSLIDILIVWFMFYHLIKMIQNKRALNILYGVIVILGIKLLSTVFHLETLDWLLNNIIQWAVLGVIIIFQPEIRMTLERLGQQVFARKRNQATRGEQMVEAIVEACEYMSKRRIGALMTIENERPLTDIAKTGIALDAEITSQLLINIFIPNTPLHDGAVIIQDERITSAASFLPLSENPDIPKELGTRHRAAVGVSEVTDALTVVVSEETGEVSITSHGRLKRKLSQDDLRQQLTDRFVTKDDDSNNSMWSNWFDTLFTTNKKKGGRDDD
ncbi:MAG: diadenylate cyclase CdaA [Aerococcus sp.]|nr:diadenylate cyclase CdaA [Aerococcus sp.]